MIKISGAEYKLFDKEPWPEDWWVEECEFTVNGVQTEDNEFPDVNAVHDDDIITIDGGWIVNSDDSKEKPVMSLTYEKMIRKWKKKQTEKIIMISCKISDAEAVVEAVRKAGGKVVMS